MCLSVKKMLKFRYVIIFVAFFILFAMIFHAIGIHHDHIEEIFGHNEQKAFLHGGDKKYWFLALLAIITVAAKAIGNIFNREKYLDDRQLLYSMSIYFLLVASHIFNPVREALRKGILNPKLCE